MFRIVIAAALIASPALARTGERSCLPLTQIDSVKAESADAVLFKLKGGEVWRNKLPVQCRAWTRSGVAYKHTTTVSSICRSDIVQLFDPMSGMGYGGCGLGGFEKVEKPKG
jgi:hypothetical protein